MTLGVYRSTFIRRAHCLILHLDAFGLFALLKHASPDRAWRLESSLANCAAKGNATLRGCWHLTAVLLSPRSVEQLSALRGNPRKHASEALYDSRDAKDICGLLSSFSLCSSDPAGAGSDRVDALSFTRLKGSSRHTIVWILPCRVLQLKAQSLLAATPKSFRLRTHGPKDACRPVKFPVRCLGFTGPESSSYAGRALVAEA